MGSKCLKLELPEDIIINILSRLPVRPLLRFRCVSKPWLDMISDNSFIKVHLNRRKKHPEKDKLFHISATLEFFTLDLQCTVSTAIKLNFPSEKNLDLCCRIWGSCEGLLLLSSMNIHSLFLVNPSTRESKLVLNLIPTEKNEMIESYSFGYDSLTCSYMVLRISVLLLNRPGSYENKLILYNLRTNTWKKLKCPHHLPLLTKTVHLNGVIHLVKPNRLHDHKSWGVISLDLSDERFSCLPLPGSKGKLHRLWNLSVLGNCLCVFDVEFGHIIVWVMKEYGVADSWTKFSIHVDNIVREFPMCSLRSGKVVMDGGTKLVISCPEYKEHEEILLQDLPLRPDFPNLSVTVSYIESLVRVATL